MVSLGNDIVDLCASDPAHPRFSERTCSTGERAWIAACARPAAALWLFWAAKEASYKAISKRWRTTIFSPARIVVEWRGADYTDQMSGCARYNGVQCELRADTREDVTHCIAWVGARDIAVARQRGGAYTQLPSCHESVAVRTLAQALAGQSLPGAEIRTAADGIPRIYQAGLAQPAYDVSLAHHGRFVAAAVCIPEQEEESCYISTASATFIPKM